MPPSTSAWPCPDLSWFDTLGADSLLERPVSCIPRVPERLQAQYRAAKLVLLEKLAEAGTAAERLRAWKALLLLDRFLLWKGFRRGGKGRGGIRQNASERAVAERLSLFWAGQWVALARPAHDAIRPARRRRGPVPPERIRELVEDGAWRRLLAALRGGAPMLDSPEVVDDLRRLLPEESTADNGARRASAVDIPDDDFRKAVAQELREASPHAAAGRDGSRATHWQVGSGDEHFERLLARALKHWLDGEAPEELDDIFSRQTLFVLQKISGGIRPIAVGAFLRRLALRALLRCKRQEVQDAVGSMRRRRRREALSLTAASGNSKTVLSLDLKNAYGTVGREAAQAAVRDRTPWMRPLVDRLLNATTRNAYDTVDGDTIWIEQGTGVPQGCPLSTFLFCVTLAGVGSDSGRAPPARLWD